MLYALPVTFFVLLTILTANPPVIDTKRDWKDIDFLQFESVRLFQEYLKIDTSYPDGSEIAGAEYLASILAAEGINVHVERLGERNANMWAELPGENPRALVLHNHMDVIPALRLEEWRFDPFGGEIELPFIYGRGAFDMKSIAIAQIMAMLELKRSGEKLKRSVLFMGTGEEERDSFLGTQRVLRQHPELRERMWAMLTEGGAIEAVSVEEARYWGTEFQQKHFVDVWVCDGNLERLTDLRNRIQAKRTDRRLTPTLEAFLSRYGPTRDRPETREILAPPSQLLKKIRAYHRDVDVTVIPPNIEAILRSKVVAFPIEEDPEGGYLMRVILHLQSDLVHDDVWNELIGDALDGFTYRIEDINGTNHGSPLDHELFVRIDQFMARERPSIVHGPLSIPFAATDARFFRDYGIPSYGFTPFHIISSDTGGMKGVNERMALPAFVPGVSLYVDLVRELVSEEATLGKTGDN
ncbi:MAG: M20/M25/M40 family metallo-hydrolase [Acidobacteriota bacterium]